MAKKNVTNTLNRRSVTITEIEDGEYISLSDMSREDGGIQRIQNWMRNRDTIDFLTAWEEIHNPDFNVVQMHNITKDAGRSRVLISPKQWIEETAAIGLVSKVNLRDYAEIAHLHVLANLEGTNAILIERGLPKEERFEILAQAAISQYKRLSQDTDLGRLEA